jgi:phosphatidylglycerol:prolipoprotein diacylglycerol transferase
MLRLKTDAIGDLMTWLIIGVMAGGRLGWWLFYHRPEPTPEPWYEPIAIWHGGMSFHGALIGVTLAFVLWSWWHRAPMWNIADAAALVTPVGLFLGRLANFANAELVGRVTDVPWGMIFPGETVPRHPSQLYEAALEGPVLLAIVWLARRFLPRRDGAVASVFVVAYGVIRFCVEFTREPDVQLGFIAFGWLTMGQLLSLLLIVIGIALLAWRLWSHGQPAILPAR